MDGVMVTMEARQEAFMRGRRACVSSIVPRTFSLQVRSARSKSVFSKGMMISTAALLTSTSSFSSSAAIRRVSSWMSSDEEMSARMCLPPIL
jgi:hypothetical protein